MSIFEIDAMREAREQEIMALLKKRDRIQAEIKRCKEAGPLMMSLCKELTDTKKKLRAARGI